MLISWQEESASAVKYFQLQSDGAIKHADSVLVLPSNTSNRNMIIILTQALIKFFHIKVHNFVIQIYSATFKLQTNVLKSYFQKPTTNVIWI